MGIAETKEAYPGPETDLAVCRSPCRIAASFECRRDILFSTY